MNRVFPLLAFIAIIFSYCSPSATSDRSPAGDASILLGTLEEAAMDTVIIGKMSAAIMDNIYPNIHSVLIAKDGKLVYEKYFPGEDQIWGDGIGNIAHSVSTLHDVRSISKSVVSACIGIAVAHGKIKSIKQRVFEYFPEHKKYDSGLRSQLTLEHLLTMSSGIKWNEEVPYDNPENSEIQMIRSKDPIEFVLSRPMENPPGKVWKYNGGTTQLLAAIIKKVSGMAVDKFADEYLFKPLRIKEFDWIKYPNTDMPAAASGLRLRSRDLLKFGWLYSNGGKWGQEQIIDKTWVESSFTSHVPRGENGGYGFQFWIWNDTLMDTPKRMIAAIGNGDQRIYIDRTFGLVVVTTAGNYNKWDIRNNSYSLLKEFIYPALKK